MFGSLAHIAPGPRPTDHGPPRDVPSPTPINLPVCLPQGSKPRVASAQPGPPPRPGPEPHLSALLQALTRPADQVQVSHLEALGAHVTQNASLRDLLPDTSSLPDFDHWDSLSPEAAQAVDAQSHHKLCNGRQAPGVLKYVDLRHSLLLDNGGAFRAVRRLAPRPGEQYARLGYCHEFYKCLEPFTGFWDDTSVSQSSNHLVDQSCAQREQGSGKAEDIRSVGFCRTSAGSAMPVQYRTQLLSSFLRLVTYDFSCSITSRQEPRLYLKSSVSMSPAAPQATCAPAQKHSYFSFGCSFLFRTPTDRESAKRGIIDGPVAAVSPRHTTIFPPVGKERESAIDLSREIIAALITAQHRAREGRQEKRIGKDAWWANKPRWGGGPGGPIGREADSLEEKDNAAALSVGDKDESPYAAVAAAAVEGEPVGRPAISASSSPSGSRSLGRNRAHRSSPLRNSSSEGEHGQPPNPKRPRKGLVIYDAYRMVRPPSLHWDPRTRYTAIGRQRGAEYDDVFVISSLFHHVSILRVRVPDRLLEVLDGAPDDKDWGTLNIWRTRWYDFFIPDDRVEAMKCVWGVMAYAMRNTEQDEDEDEDKMIYADANGEGGNARDTGSKITPISS